MCTASSCSRVEIHTFTKINYWNTFLIQKTVYIISIQHHIYRPQKSMNESTYIILNDNHIIITQQKSNKQFQSLSLDATVDRPLNL